MHRIYHVSDRQCGKKGFCVVLSKVGKYDMYPYFF